ncbi:MAG: AbiTii domain-containing protein [Syntrophales bacterium]
MKKFLVLEIQQLATESHHDISDLLRKALLAATKLKLKDFKYWVNQELNGYREGDVPNYRKITASVYLKNPYHGLIPVHFPTQEIYDVFCSIEVRDPIGNLAAILSKQDDSKTGPIYPLTQKQEDFLLSQQDCLGMPPVRTISNSAVATILDAVRTQILEWSLKLEEQGILGEGMTFSENEKELATKSQEINIQNFQGVFGNIENSSVTQNIEMKINKNDFESLKKYLLSRGILEQDISDLHEAISCDSPPKSNDKFGDKVSTWMGKMVSKAAFGSWQVTVGAAGSLLAKAICLYYGV